MDTKSRIVLWLCLGGAIGAWLMQQSQDAPWIDLLTPWNVGALLVGLTSTLGAAFGVNGGSLIAKITGNGKTEVPKDVN